ncbi:MAG: iron-responsive transcriptional regulator RirA [Pseudomonadota bacterium]
MRLTKHTNYAVRMLMFCASNPEELSRVNQIAKFYNLPEPFLLKILQSLTKAGYVTSVRGRNGGIRLARDAQDIGLGEVVRTIEENFELAECFQDGEAECPLVTSCGLSSSLKKALDAFFAVLDEYTIHDLANNQRNLNILVQLEAATRIPFEPGTAAKAD